MDELLVSYILARHANLTCCAQSRLLGKVAPSRCGVGERGKVWITND